MDGTCPLAVKRLTVNPYTLQSEEVGEDSPYGVWKIVEQTGAGWFPWADAFGSKESATAQMLRVLGEWFYPETTTIQGKPATWPESVQAKWRKHVAARFSSGQTCERANYYEPRPRGSVWDKGSEHYGFVYTVWPGPHVFFVEWTEDEEVTV